MIAANALLANHPWNRLRPSLVKSGFAREMLLRSDIPENVREALQAGDGWYDDAVLITSRWINEQMQRQQQEGLAAGPDDRRLGGGGGGGGSYYSAGGGAVAGGGGRTQPGDAAYTPETLTDYDQYVWGFNGPFLWRIHVEEIKGLYNDCLLRSARHAEVGCGTGLFLRELNVPESLTEVTLLDSNYNSLEACQRLLTTHPHYEYSRVQFQTLHGNVLEPPPYELRDRYDSVAANFLLHCLPGGNKACYAAIENLAALLNPRGGVMFGSTILGQAVVDDAERAGPAAVETLQLFNDVGIFGNMQHSYRDLSRMLHDTFDDVEIWRAGYCAVWKARQRRR
jgi:2-polyprenyl-3-methyl-5-hydroxy-6-metoxy-1,4-benzoquinol methylase